MKKIALFFLLGLLSVASVDADIKVAKIFGPGMVLQKGLKNPIWGWADKGEKIKIEFAGKTIHTRANKEGKWLVKLPEMDYGGPYKMVISGNNTIVFDDILIGEVWVCSGQSNMEFSVQSVKNSTQEIAEANYPKLRMFTVPKRVSQSPEADLAGGEWEICTPETVGDFSAVGYFFARDLMKDLQVPVGMIHTSWGGTVAETWISPDVIENDPDFNNALGKLKTLDLDNYAKEKTKKMADLFGGKIPAKDKGILDGKAVFADPKLDDKNWSTINAPELWESEGYADVDGICWYRKHVYLTKEQAENVNDVYLAKIDDQDITWINGKEIGKTNEYNLDRIYKIEPGVLHEGDNVIAIRVLDTGGGGGIYGNKDALKFKTSNGDISLAGDWKVKFTEVFPVSSYISPNAYPTLLYNGMLNPIIPYGIKGAIWYQGESNADRAYQYRRVFKSLITDWRTHWDLGDFPFLWVQLANFMPAKNQPAESEWAELREAQTMALDLPNTGMALAIDIGNANDIHPKNKQDVGKRLELNALKVAYGKDVVNSGPTYESMEINGNKVIIHFSNTGSGLMLKDKYGYLKAFAVAGKDKVFHWARGKLLDNNSVVIYSDEVENPVAVRFGWADNPDDLNLYNKEGLPAVPFRTDTWKGITEK
ncbi:sialate O-acetylesterase [Saccharicrinis sp. FJH62]|uniref:sialate O-acetylesterase n=1 Tax=Saccharicrinis sp. FJH62 TaxID=3344657 RepID=UPI0035D4B30C